jgi:tRNA(Ser,Leu) C12 N-acetylase TAN1
MNTDQQEQKKFLEEQLEWSKKQVRILDEIDMRLHEMKKIAEYAVEHELSANEKIRLNTQLKGLKCEVDSLEKQLHTVVH